MHANAVIAVSGPESDAVAYAVRRLQARGWPVSRFGAPESPPPAVRLALRAMMTASPSVANAWRTIFPTLPILLIHESGVAPAGDPHTLTLTPPFEIAHVVRTLEKAIRSLPAPPRPIPPTASRIRTGADIIDGPQGGVPRGRVFTVCGRSGTGKTALALQYLSHGLARGERVLLLSDRPAAEIASYAQHLRLPLTEAVESGALIALSYRDYTSAPLQALGEVPPSDFTELLDIIQSNHVRRAVLDPCLPWLTVGGCPAAAPAQSFVRALDRTEATTLLTLPRPTSTAAERLTAALEAVASLAIRLELDSHGRRTATVSEGSGNPIGGPEPYIIEPGIGLRRLPAQR